MALRLYQFVQRLHSAARIGYSTSSTTNPRSDSAYPKSVEEVPNPLPAIFLRGGTSKGVFFSRRDLPTRDQWDSIFLSVMGSPDPTYGRQLNGMGGGVSSLSKVIVVDTPSEGREGIDVEYTFAQIGVRDSVVDYAGNCGNLTSVVGMFALDSGLVTPDPLSSSEAGPRPQRTRTLTLYNTNTEKRIRTTFPVDSAGMPLDSLPQVSISGVPGSASRIVCEYLDPAGAKTGKLLPSGKAREELVVGVPNEDDVTVRASLIDASNPTVFVSLADLAVRLPVAEYLDGDAAAEERIKPVLEALRQEGAKRMGMKEPGPAQPKIALLNTPAAEADGVDIVIHALSMGVLHRAVPITVALALGVASHVEGSIAWDIVQANSHRPDSGKFVNILHPAGVISVGADLDTHGRVLSANVVRTGRRLMRGEVWH